MFRSKESCKKVYCSSVQNSVTNSRSHRRSGLYTSYICQQYTELLASI